MLGTRIPVVLLLAIVCGSTNSLAGQQFSQSSAAQKPEVSTLVFKSVVNRVVVDVVVTDINGRPVRDLTARDFSVTEDTVPQRVLSFDVHNLDKVSGLLPPHLPQLPPNTFLNLPKAPETGPLYVLLVDLVNTGPSDQMWARQQLLKFIDGKPEGTRFAVFLLSDGLHLVQGFTSDRELLHAAVDPSHPKHHVPRVFLYSRSYGAGDQTLMLSVFQDIVQYLDGLPGRKNLMWMAGSFPLSIYVNEGDAFDTADDVKQLIDTMAKAQVAVYTFAAGGLSVEDPHAGATVMPRGGQVVPGPSSAGLTYLTVSHLTGATGGESYFENNLQEELGVATENGATYYSLTYAPSNEKYDGKLRKIGVSIAKRGYKLSYRRSYYADDPNAPRVQKVSAKDEPQPEPPRKPGDSLIANMEYGAPMAHELVFRAHLQAVGTPALGTPAQMANLADQPAYFQVRKKNRPVKPLKPVLLQTYVVDYLVLLPPKVEGEKPLALELATAAFDGDGSMLNGVVENGSRIPSAEPRLARVQGGARSLARDTNEKGIYRAQQRIDVPVGATTIRVAVRDMNSDRIGAMEVNLPLAVEPQTQAAAPAAPKGADPVSVRVN